MTVYLSEVKGKNGIVARVVAKSVSSNDPNSVIVTWEVEHHRWILAEINKHRMFSNNYQSSRAVPVSKIIEQVKSNPATPIFWGKNQAGMQAKEECLELVDVWDIDKKQYCSERFCKEDAWYYAACLATDAAKAFNDAGYHKQIVNRLLEPFMLVKGVITATEIDNFFHLRCHPDAQPELQELANCMWEAYVQAKAEMLHPGEWHTPYVGHFRASDGDTSLDYCYNGVLVGPLVAKRVSAAACAQVSFRKLDLSHDTVDRVYSRLVDTEQPHSVCMEHQATPMPKQTYSIQGEPWEEGTTHVDRCHNLWSGNFKGWVQNRKLLINETCNHFKGRDKVNDAE